MHILSLQPYFGGSHKAFQEQWQAHSDFDWTVLSLPPRHWKWRMRHAAVHFSEQVQQLASYKIDAIFCSDFLNVAEFRGLAPKHFRELPIVVYFHENQFAYPSRRHDERDLHFGFTNFTSCLSADVVWFNSAFNRDSFMSGIETAMKKWPDFLPRNEANSLHKKIRIEPPGIEMPAAARITYKQQSSRSNIKNKPLVLTWAARWEHDKNPQGLLDGLRELSRLNVDFRLNVLGESFRRVPEPFENIQKEFQEHIDHWGYQESRERFWEILSGSDLFLSTAHHEFFGIAAAEAIVAGTIPLLPDRLAYPELINIAAHPNRKELFLYDGSPVGMAKRIKQLTEPTAFQQSKKQANELSQELIQRLDWKHRASEMDLQLASLVQQTSK